MENDLISRSELIEILKKLATIEWNKKAAPVSWSDAYESFIDSLEEAPAVDAVPVVRCKDCKAFMEYSNEFAKVAEGADGDCYIRVMNSDDHQFCAVKYDEFCSYGERRADDGK